MNHSEYLRRKLESLPKVYGPARPGDASETTRIRGAIAAAAGRVRAHPPANICCGPRVSSTPMPSGVVVYKSSPIRVGPGCGLSEDRSHSRSIAVAAGCAMIGAGLCGSTVVPEIRESCCPQEWTPEVPRDAAGNRTDPTKKAEAYKGRVGCCEYQGLPLQAFGPMCCRPAGNIDTNTMTDVPGRLLPIVPAEKAHCCPAPALSSVDCCCDANGYPL